MEYKDIFRIEKSSSRLPWLRVYRFGLCEINKRFSLCFRFQNGKKMVYLPLLFVDELSNRVKDLVVSFNL